MFSVTPVIAVAISDEPGSFSQIIKLLGDNGINIEYTYAFTAREKDMAYMIFRVADEEKAIEVLTSHGKKLITQDELNQI